MIHPPKKDESQIALQGNPDDSGFRRDALGDYKMDITTITEALESEIATRSSDKFGIKVGGELSKHLPAPA